MYALGHKVEKPKKRYKVLKILLIMLLVLILLFILWYFLRPKVVKNDPTSQILPTKFETVAKKHISEPLYEFDVPQDWKESARTIKPYKMVSWIGTTREAISRQIDIYTDTIPINLAVNRMVPLSGQDDTLAVGQMSSNCIEFTGEAAKLTPEQAGKSKTALTKWEDVQFLCDIPNELRNVTGAASTEGINRVTVTGQTGGKHAYFFVYTDHTAHPSDATFTDMLRSFKAR